MSLTKGKDYVFAPKATLVTHAVVFASLVGTRKHIFVVPKEDISGGGSTIETTKYSISGDNLTEGVEKILQDPDMTIDELEKTLNKILFEDLKLDKDRYLLEIGKLAEFNVKAGFFSKGVYYKKPEDKRFKGIGISGKESAQAFQAFYGKQG